MTIRIRILALFSALLLMAGGEALMVMYFQHLTSESREQVDRRARVRDLQARLEVALLELRSAARTVVRGGAAEAPSLEAARQEYAGTVRELRTVMTDPSQVARIGVLEDRVEAWSGAWRPWLDAEAGAVDVDAALARVSAGFADVRGELEALRARQDALYAAAQEASHRTFRRSTIVMLLIPGVAIAIIALALAAVHRVVLDPLADLASKAERITAGEVPALSSSGRRDEIGALINAFTNMIARLRDRETELSGALALSRDLTSRHKQAEEIANRARAEIETVIETVPAALLLVHETDGVRLQNRAATRLIGGPPPGDAVAGYQASFTLAGRDGAELPPARWPMMRALAGEIVAGEEVIVRSADGRELPMLVSAAPMADATGAGAVVVFQDVSALKAVDRLKDEFVSIVSHELRTPLTSIRGSLQLVLDDPASLPVDDHRELVKIALNNCERLIRIINDILDVAKIEAGKVALHVEPAGVRELVRTAIENVEGIARAASVTFDLRLPDDLPAVDADADRIVQVLVNLLSNAVKFAPPKSRVTVEAARAGAMIEIAIADRGKGIAAADVSRLFQKFQQLDSSTTRATGGTGLGLAIVRGLVEQHGGTVAVDSRPGDGTRFAFTLPVASGEPVEARGPARGQTAAARVLVVDDDDDFRGVTRRQLERAGFQVTEARDGVEALTKARAERPDVITVDLLMPSMNGWTLIRSLADDPELADIPTVVLSAVADRAGNLARDVAVLAKASGIEALLAEITSLLPSTGSGEILVAEDDDDLRSLLARTLRKRGFTTREARDGAQALSMVDEHVALLVLDLNMPEVDGLEVLRRLRERPLERQIPVLVITGTEGSRGSAMALGASGYLTKPLEVTEVARVVQRLVARR